MQKKVKCDDSRLRRGRSPFLRLIALSMAATFSLSACSMRLDLGPDSLPQLTGIDALRDSSARIEAASAQQLQLLASKATSCASCQEALAVAADDATQRLERLGGLWDPWAGYSAEELEGATPTPPIAHAPWQTSELITWMADTAARDIDAAVVNATDSTRTETVDAPHAELVEVAIDRLISASALAQAMGVEINAGQDSLDTVAGLARSYPWIGTDMSAVSLDTTVNDWVLQETAAATDTAQSANDASPDPTVDLTDPLLTQALQTWDCAAQEINAVALTGDLDMDIEAVRHSLSERAQKIVTLGVADLRIFRCNWHSTDATELADVLIKTDTALALSPNATIRGLGITALRDDVATWHSALSR